MIKVVILAVMGLLVGVGGGSAVSVMRAKGAHAAAVARRAQAVADSVAKAEDDPAIALLPAVARLQVAGGAPEPARPVTASGPGDASAPKPGTDPGSTAPVADAHGGSSRAVETVDAREGREAIAAAAVAAAAARLSSAPAIPPVGVKPSPAKEHAAPPGSARVAKIFASMPPKDAARVLQQLDDEEVQAVIAGISEKQAAAILQLFPAERAAAVSRAALRTVVTKP